MKLIDSVVFGSTSRLSRHRHRHGVAECVQEYGVESG